jgi:hypothetical protein
MNSSLFPPLPGEYNEEEKDELWNLYRSGNVPEKDTQAGAHPISLSSNHARRCCVERGVTLSKRATFRHLLLFFAWVICMMATRCRRLSYCCSCSEAFHPIAISSRINNKFHMQWSSDKFLKQPNRDVILRDTETNRLRDPFEKRELLVPQESESLDSHVDADGNGSAKTMETSHCLAADREVNRDGGSSSGGGSRLGGLLSLVTVPMVWGTYVPAVRFMYDNQVPGFVFSACYHIVSAVASAIVLRLTTTAVDRSPSVEPKVHGSSADAVVTKLTTIAAKGDGGESRDTTHEAEDGGDGSMVVAFRGGLELGTYTFVASSMQVVGLETVPSDRAGFLIQRTFRYEALTSLTSRSTTR